MLNRTVLKEFQESNLKSFSDGQININFPDENDLTKVDVVLTPTGGFYNGGTFLFAVNLPTNYPDAVASISCRTKIFHPNIDFTGHICFNLLSGTTGP
jgi:ubiquitin-protein ligase